MRRIKFSHEYMKMPDDFEESAVLEVFIADRSDLCPEFVEFDTAIVDAGNYPLPRGKLLILLLQTRSFQLWTTIRRWTAVKEKYYRGLRGEYVECAAPLVGEGAD
jgi:hypothetical protein